LESPFTKKECDQFAANKKELSFRGAAFAEESLFGLLPKKGRFLAQLGMTK
jgi:hypothetical protein